MSKSTSRRGKATSAAIPETTSIDIPFNRLRLSEKNVRTIYDKDAIKQLSESIAENGLIQALSVRPVLDTDGNETGDYEVQAGGRRFRALELLTRSKRRAIEQLDALSVEDHHKEMLDAMRRRDLAGLSTAIARDVQDGSIRAGRRLLQPG